MEARQSSRGPVSCATAARIMGPVDDGQASRTPLQGVQSRYVELRPGMVVTLYAGDGRAETQVRLRNDSTNVHFCCLLRGTSQGVIRGQVLSPAVGEGYVVFAPGEDFAARYGPDYLHVDLMVAPDVLAELVGDDVERLDAEIASGFILQAIHAGNRTIEAATRLASQLSETHFERLYLYAAALNFLGAHFSEIQEEAREPVIPPHERQRLLVARDRLLRDLSAPPTIAELAREIGLNQLKLKRGFKAVFGTSVYALFQQHRMERARQLLRDHSVTETALTLGYSNLSHFSTAYRKQFGILPRTERKKSASLSTLSRKRPALAV